MFDIALNPSDLNETTLNGKMFPQIVNSNLKQMIIDHLFQKYGIKMNCTNKYFVSIESDTDIAILKKYHHLAYANTNQKIFLLILASFKEQPVCLLIDKQTYIFYVIKCQFSHSLYKGTIFEGEMINGVNDNYFVISDFLGYLQKNVCSYALDKRLTLLRSITSPKNYHYDPLLDPFQIMVKDFVEYSELMSYVKDYLPTLPYKNKVTGMIFRPVEISNKNLIYNLNRKTSSYNTKSSIDMSVNTNACESATAHLTQLSHMVDEDTSTSKDANLGSKINIEKFQEVKFLLFETDSPDSYHLKLFGPHEQLIQYDLALVNDIKTSKMLQKTIDDASQIQKNLGICFLCRYNSNFCKWKPIQVISDQPDYLGKLL